MQYLLIYVLPFLPSGIPWGIHLITRLHCSALRHFCLLWRLLTSHGKSFSTTGGIFQPIPVSVRPRGISRQSFLVYLPDLRTWVTVAFWTSLSYVSLSAIYALYQVSVRQATISLSLLLACTSRCKPWESLWGSSATTPLVDFHHRLTACPSYIKRTPLISDVQVCGIFPGAAPTTEAGHPVQTDQARPFAYIFLLIP